MSERNNTCSSDKCSGILIVPTSANGTRAYCAWPPAKPPSMCVYPYIPAGEWPKNFWATHAFGLVFSQSEYNSRRQKKQFPQEIGKDTTTRSPVFSFFTALPTSTTSPMNSCPRMSPFSIVGTKPLYKWRSDPQIAVELTFIIASWLLRISGSGTSTTWTSRLPNQQLAFMELLLFRRWNPDAWMPRRAPGEWFGRISTTCWMHVRMADLSLSQFRRFP